MIERLRLLSCDTAVQHLYPRHKASTFSLAGVLIAASSVMTYAIDPRPAVAPFGLAAAESRKVYAAVMIGSNGTRGWKRHRAIAYTIRATLLSCME